MKELFILLSLIEKGYSLGYALFAVSNPSRIDSNRLEDYQAALGNYENLPNSVNIISELEEGCNAWGIIECFNRRHLLRSLSNNKNKEILDIQFKSKPLFILEQSPKSKSNLTLSRKCLTTFSTFYNKKDEQHLLSIDSEVFYGGDGVEKHTLCSPSMWFDSELEINEAISWMRNDEGFDFSTAEGIIK